ncbi:hypothetical protein HLH44_16385 [Gluconacetobacter sp. 1c LMG 22058]|uniref:Uncharacterized protein n=1 Tax=Gluconacetobacter dulcium TaxID=2729096 RepID=A0A7W4K264_9PROT|nr:hypothetical protein [Gluconacetobacter dulcium]MBB2199011.1 hypothetical protein [Gluconacetobacter dulcium]
MSRDQSSGQIVIDAVDFQVPCRRFAIKANVTRDRQMPVVDEFVLRLIHIVQRITGPRLSGYFGFAAHEMETVLLELVERGLIESDEQEFCLSPKGHELFKGLSDGDLPRLAAVEGWTEFVWFDLISRNMISPTRYRPFKSLIALPEQARARDLPEAYAREAFEQNFHDYARRIRRHPDADRLAIYSVSEVEPSVYGYQTMAAESWLAGAALDSNLHLPFADEDPARFAPLSMAAADAWGLLTGPDETASGLADYERLTGDDRPARLRASATDPSVWGTALSSGTRDGASFLFGASYLDHNVDKLCKTMEVALAAGRTMSGPAIIWLRPAGTAWGRTFKVSEALQRVRDTLSASAIRNVPSRLMVPRGVPAAVRRNFKHVFDDGRLSPPSFYPGDLEILLVPGVAASVFFHLDTGRHGLPLGLASREERFLRTIERRFSDVALNASDALWTMPPER